MPSVTYMNQSAPFWDFVASLEQQGQNHPFFSQNQNQGQNGNTERGEEGHPPGPWGWGWGFPRAFPHRGPPPPPGPPGPPGPPPYHDDPMEDHENNNEKEKEKEKENHEDNGEGPSNNSGSDSEGWGRRGRHGRCGGGRRGHGFGPRGACGREGFGPHHGPPHHGPGPWGRCGRGRGGWGWGSWGGRSGGPFNPMNFAASLFDPSANKEANENQDFTPDADIFDTPSSFVIHVSLPGAKKEDVGVNWDAEKSELSIAGVIYRPGDEEFLKTLAMDERKVGPFERKVRLGTRANPAQIDAEGITAKLEDGILRVEVPKLEQDFVEVKKVDIE